MTYVPIHPPLTADLQGPCLGRRSALGKRASECQQPGKSYEWLVDGGGQRAFHSLHPAGEKKNRIFNLVCGAYESSSTQVNPLQSSTFFTTLNHNLVNHHSHHRCFFCISPLAAGVRAHLVALAARPDLLQNLRGREQLLFSGFVAAGAGSKAVP